MITSEVTTMDLSSLNELLHMSKSLVFVPDRAAATLVSRVCHDLGLAQWVSAEQTLLSTVFQFENNHENFATICLVPNMITGWLSEAEQVIWIGPTYCEPAIFRQAVNRAPGRPVYHLQNSGVVP